ncbi:hypothetical protein [Natronoarchaeum philippinense]|uniref:hypothetical protein n=1 Tax=Natronoarchaeum philippinense TaxID=558529 RepID=UPI0035BF93E0
MPDSFDEDEFDPLDTDEQSSSSPDSASPHRDPDAEIDDTPTIACTRCGREWDLGYELDDLGIGNQAIEQFALDHKRHTGHYPDGVAPWLADCRHCPEGVERLSEEAARRWAQTHARHTRHAVDIGRANDDESSIVDAPDE